MKSITQKIVKSLLLFSIFFSLFAAHAQVPQKMSYQAVIRNASNALVVNTAVAVRVSVFDAANGATPVYVERHTTTTNNNGLATFNIGTGTIISGVFASINWANIPVSIKTETDPAGGTNYTIVGTNDLTSVPFSLNSGDNRWVKIGNNITNNNSGNVGIGNFSPDFPLSFPTTYGQKISLWGNAAASAGFGVQPGKLQMFTEVSGSDIEFGYGSSTALTSNMIIKGTGNVGIGINNPGTKLDILGGNWNLTGTSAGDFRVGNASNNFKLGVATTGSGAGHTTMTSSLILSLGTGTTDPNVRTLNVGGGNVGIGTISPTTKLEVNGFTKLGTDAPAIKVKKLTGTTVASQGGFATIPHGLINSKILSVTALVEYFPTFFVPASNSRTGFEFYFFIENENIFLYNSPTNSANLISKPFKIMITYEE